MRITVCITSYNQEQYLAEAIDSVLAQTRPADEILIVDDASTDGSRELIRSCANRHGQVIRPVLLEENSGAAHARNQGLQRAGGDALVFLDGDDRFLPEKLQHEAGALENNPGVQMVYSNINYVNEQGEFLCRWADGAPAPAGDVFTRVFARQFPRGNLFRNELVLLGEWRDTGDFDLKLRNLYEDYDMRIRLTRRLRTYYVDMPLSEYRLHGAGLSSVDFQRHYEAFAYILGKNRPLLDGRDPAERKQVLRAFQRLLARHAARAARNSLNSGRPLRAASLGARALIHRYF